MNKIFYQRRNNLPTVNEVGRLLKDKRLVKFEKNIYTQTDRNCLEIASQLAELFGYRPLASQRELTDAIFSMGNEQLWGGLSYPRFYHKSPVCFIVRTRDNTRAVHVTFEAYGREYNYGPAKREGFPIEMRIPLFKKLDNFS